MSEIIDLETAIAEPAASSANDAAIRCCKAWRQAYSDEIAKHSSKRDARTAASEAYRLAMPTLSSEESIRDFIACAAHGILLGAFKDRQGSQLLYAAQVASGAIARTRKSHRQRDLPSKKAAT